MFAPSVGCLRYAPKDHSCGPSLRLLPPRLAKTKDGTWQPEAVTDVRRAAWARWRRGGSCGHGKFLELLDATEPGVWAQNWPSSSAATLLRVSKTANEFFRQHRFPMALCCNQAWRGRQLLIMNPAKRLELLANVKILCAKHKVTHLTMDKCCLGAPTTQERWDCSLIAAAQACTPWQTLPSCC